MADLSAFSASHFHSSTWINAALKDKPEEEALESYLAQLAMKLHIIAQDYTDQLETGMVEAMSAMPKVLSDIKQIEDTLSIVESELKSLGLHLQTFDSKNIGGVEDLSRLDVLKGNMERCKATLEEHARWNQLVREARSFLEAGGKLADTADRIETMHRSLKVLENMPGHADRQNTCSKLTDSLLTTVRPRVRLDITGHDLTPLLEYLHVYDRLGRRRELEDEYVKSRPSSLSLVWASYKTVSPENTSSPEAISAASTSDRIKFFAHFLAQVSTLISEEISNTTVLFGQERASDILCDMIAEFFSPLGPELEQRLRSFSPVACLEIYKIFEDFARSLSHRAFYGSDTRSVLKSLSTILQGFFNYVDEYFEKEGETLSHDLEDVVSGITFDCGGLQVSLDDGEDERFTRSRAAGIIVQNSLKFNTADPMQSYDVFSQRLIAAAESAYTPCLESLGRGMTFLGALKVKTASRRTANVLAGFAKRFLGKIEDLRTACGLPARELRGGGGGVAGAGVAGVGSGTAGSAATLFKSTKAAMRSGLPTTSTADIETISTLSQSVQQAGNWARLLETCDISPRSLLPIALRTLQAAGRLAHKLRALESIANRQFSYLSPLLFREPLSGPWDLSTVDSVYAHPLILQFTDSVGSSAASATAFVPGDGFPTAVGLAVAANILRSDPIAASELQSFLLSAGTQNRVQPAQSIFTAAASPLARIKIAAGALLFDLCIALPEKTLSNLSSEDLWATGAISSSSSSSDSIPVESDDNYLPLSVVTQVGEHLLSLVADLETFAASDALPDLILLRSDAETLTVTSSGWRSICDALGIVREDECLCVEQLCRRASVGAAVAAVELSAFGAVLSVSPEDQDPSAYVNNAADLLTLGDKNEGDEEFDAAALGFVNEWLGALADAAVGLIIAQTAAVPVFSPSGCAQLRVDLEYMNNVFNALGLKPHPLLSHIRQLLLRPEPNALMSALTDSCATSSRGNATAASVLAKLNAKILTAVCRGHGLASCHEMSPAASGDSSASSAVEFTDAISNLSTSL